MKYPNKNKIKEVIALNLNQIYENREDLFHGLVKTGLYNEYVDDLAFHRANIYMAYVITGLKKIQSHIKPFGG
jgi:hypothetical protein